MNEGATIWGYVQDEVLEVPIKDLSIEVEREFYLGNSTITDVNGYYRMDIPSGDFVLRIYDQEDLIIYRLDFNISDGDVKRLDFTLDPRYTRQSRVYGTILHQFTLTPMDSVDIEIFKVDSNNNTVLIDSSSTDDLGKFDVPLPAGTFDIKVISKDDQIFKKRFELKFREEKKFELTLEDPASAFNLENFINLIKEKWLPLVFIIVVLVVGPLLIASADRVFKAAIVAIQKKPRRFIDRSIIIFCEKVVKWNLLIFMFIAIAFLVAQILNIITTLWLPVRNSIASIYLIVILIVFMRISLMIWTQVVVYMRGGHRIEKPKKILSPRMLTIIEIIGKYSISFLYVLFILLTALAAIGMSDIIIGGFMNSLAANAGFIIFIVTVIILAYVIVKFMSTFFEDMKTQATKFRPEMIEIASKATKGLLYGIIGMIIVFTLLSAAGLGEVGQTLILVFSMIIGLVVSMAATGSIGNILSGLVIMSFKPFDEGDWVIIADKYKGEIIETNLMFTKLKDLENEIIEIPNNLVFSHGIVNWTHAAKEGGFAVEIDATIGYNVPAKQVISLMEDSASGVDGVLKKPCPSVVMTDFLDHAISYKLRAYVDTPDHIYKIKTKVMINMQRTFTESGVEILSPIYEVGRLERAPSKEEVKKRLKKMERFE